MMLVFQIYHKEMQTLKINPAKLRDRTQMLDNEPEYFRAALDLLIRESTISKDKSGFVKLDMGKCEEIFNWLFQGNLKNENYPKGAPFSYVQSFLERMRVADEGTPAQREKTRKGQQGGAGGESSGTTEGFMQKVNTPYWLLDWKKIAEFEIEHKDDKEAKLFIEALLESKIGYYKDGNLLVRIEWDGKEEGVAEKFKAKLFKEGLVDDADLAASIMSTYTRMLKEDGFKIRDFSKVPKEIH